MDVFFRWKRHKNGQAPKLRSRGQGEGRIQRNLREKSSLQLVSSLPEKTFLDALVTRMGEINESFEMNIDQLQKVSPDDAEISEHTWKNLASLCFNRKYLFNFEELIIHFDLPKLCSYSALQSVVR